MRFILLSLLIITTIYSCKTAQPQVAMMPHQEVMTKDYPTKKAVFLKFGVPTGKETYENIESWYYKLSEVTKTESIGLAVGSGIISQNPNNPLVGPIERSLIIQRNQLGSINSHSAMVETYLKFWFVNDSVIKWETYGVDYSRPFKENERIQPEMTVVKFAEYSNEVLFRFEDKQSNCFPLVMLGLVNYAELDSRIQNYQSIPNVFLPTIEQLKKIYQGNSYFRYNLIRNSITAWSSTIDESGMVKCFDFKHGVELSKKTDELCYFVFLVKKDK